MSISNETKTALEGARTEIVAGSVLLPRSDADRAWNQANQRAVSIIDGYLRGQGLFQMKTEQEPTNATTTK